MYHFIIGSSPEGIRILSDNDDLSAHTLHLQVVSLRNGEYLLKNIGGTDDIIVNREKVVMARVTKTTRIDIGKTHFSIKDLQDKGDRISVDRKEDQGIKADNELKKDHYSVGASNECDITLLSPRVAWKSFDLKRNGDNWFIHPVHGNRKPILWENDKILKVGQYQLIRQGNRLEVRPVAHNRLDLSSIIVTKEIYDKKEKRKKKADLANNVSLSIKSKEFVGIIGPSGAGKSVLLKAIRGIEPMTSGDIVINSQNVSENKQLLREIGFVCQNDIVYNELTVEENIVSAARFRLPSDWPAEAVRGRADQVIKQLSLEDCREKRVSDISGGQKKRVNLANELVWEPDFILADEVCSGLSAYDTNNIVRHLRNIADSGKIILLTIHTPDIETLDYMDMLLVYDKGGYIAYYGPAKEAMKYFSRNHYSPHKSPKLIFDVLEKEKTEADILQEAKENNDKTISYPPPPPRKISPKKSDTCQDIGGKSGRKTSPKEWHDVYQKSPYYRNYIESRLTPEKPESGKSSKDNTASLDGHLPKSLPKQILYLTHRRLLTFFRDKSDVLITFGQAPLMALAFFLVFNSLLDYTSLKSFEPLRKYATPDIIIFLAVLSSVWFGFDKAISEIPSSKTFYDQERLSFLSDSAFILSRFFALSIIAFGQVLLFALVFHTIFVMIPKASASFEITEQSLKGLRSENFPEDIIQKLKSLENKVYYPIRDSDTIDIEGNFLKALEGTIGQEQTVQYKAMILKSATPNKLMIELLTKFVLLLWLTSIASVATAMVISFFIKTPSAAKAILPFIIILQILMGGSRIRPLIDMEGVVYGFSKVMTSRWGFEPAAMLFETHLNNEEGTESILYRVSGNNYYKLQKREFSDIQDILRLVMLMNAVNSDKPEECVNTLRQVFKEGNAFKEVNTFIKLLNDIPLKRLIELKATAFRIALFREFYSKISDDKTKLTTKELITRIYNNFDEDLKRCDVKKILVVVS